MERICLIVPSRSSTARSIRGRRGRLLHDLAVLCSDRPMANSCWITVSWRSMAMRSRSSSTASSRTRVWSRAFSMAAPAAVGQRDRQLLVDVGERVRRLLVGEVEVPEHRAAHEDRDAEERPHRRMPRREAVAVGMLGEVGQPDGHRLGDEQAEDAVALGEGADLVRRVASSIPTAMKSESFEPVGVEHTERAVPGVDEGGGRLGDPSTSASPRSRSEPMAATAPEQLAQPRRIGRRRSRLMAAMLRRPP